MGQNSTFLINLPSIVFHYRFQQAPILSVVFLLPICSIKFTRSDDLESHERITLLILSIFHIVCESPVRDKLHCASEHVHIKAAARCQDQKIAVRLVKPFDDLAAMMLYCTFSKVKIKLALLVELPLHRFHFGFDPYLFVISPTVLHAVTKLHDLQFFRFF